jgi:very-short-patch-repair endonuclease
MTPQERMVWYKLREVNRVMGAHFRRQAPIGAFIADFADLGRRVVVEIDGGGHGGERDIRRDEWLVSQGFQVFRFWNPEVSGNIEGVMRVIFDAMGGEGLAGAPPPHPSPTRGEGGAGPAALRGTVGLGTSPPPRGEGMGVGGKSPASPGGRS